MRLFLIYLFYYIGDIISKTTMSWLNGCGYGIYSKLMFWSSSLDTEDRLWKSVKNKKNDNIKRHLES